MFTVPYIWLDIPECSAEKASLNEPRSERGMIKEGNRDDAEGRRVGTAPLNSAGLCADVTTVTITGYVKAASPESQGAIPVVCYHAIHVCNCAQPGVTRPLQ